jgi:hypothetical protein
VKKGEGRLWPEDEEDPRLVQIGAEGWIPEGEDPREVGEILGDLEGPIQVVPAVSNQGPQKPVQRLYRADSWFIDGPPIGVTGSVEWLRVHHASPGEIHRPLVVGC